MQILFIGGSGNISTACVEKLISQGHQLSALTRGQRMLPTKCEAIKADIRDACALRKAVSGRSFDAVINFLAFQPEHIQQDLDCFSGITKQYIFISSATVYEKPPRSLPITEQTPLGNPYSEYAQAKQACEELLAAEAPRHNLNFTIVRPSHTYCEEWMPNPISSAGFTLAARLIAGKPVIVPDDGQNLWTLTTSDDFAVGLAGLVGNSAAFGQVFHITSDQALTWNQIITEAALALGVNNPQITPIPTDFICQADPNLTGGIQGDKAHPALFDNAKIKALVPDFDCKTGVRAGMQRAAEWFMADPTRQRLDPILDARYERILSAWQAR